MTITVVVIPRFSPYKQITQAYTKHNKIANDNKTF